MKYIELLSDLKIDLSIKSRNFAKKVILDSDISSENLIEFILNANERNQVLFTCVLDYIIDENPSYLNTGLNHFISFQEICFNETCKRVTSRITHNLLLHNVAQFSEEQKQKLITIHFDWLIFNSLVATRVNCLSVLFELRNNADWIIPELLAVIDQQIVLKEASFVSRAKKILKKINKIT